MVLNHSEAGPDVAQCSGEEFRTAADFSKAALALKFLQNPGNSRDCKMFTEDELSQAIKMQELLFHEKHLKKEKEYTDQLNNLSKEEQILKSKVTALRKGCRASRGILEELLKIIHLWMAVKEQGEVEVTNANNKFMKDRDQALEDLKSVEAAFADLHRRYENCKSVLESYKQNEDRLKQQLADTQTKLKQQVQMYEMLKACTQEKLDSANSEIEIARKSGDVELTVLRAMLKKAEMKVSGLEKDIARKNVENTQLSSICDDLIAKVGMS